MPHQHRDRRSGALIFTQTKDESVISRLRREKKDLEVKIENLESRLDKVIEQMEQTAKRKK